MNTLKKLRLCPNCADDVVYRYPNIVFIQDINKHNCDYCASFCATSTALIAREAPKNCMENTQLKHYKGKR